MIPLTKKLKNSLEMYSWEPGLFYNNQQEIKFNIRTAIDSSRKLQYINFSFVVNSIVTNTL